MTSYCINKYTEKLCNKLTKSVSTFFVSSNNINNYGRIVATSNNIYTKSNITTKLTDNLDISILSISHKNTNLIILSNNYVVKHISITRANIINWNYKLRTYPDIYIQCPPPPDDISKKVISTILLNTLRGDD
jgi:hypothetical protein